MARVNSRDPKHRATIAKQQAARRKKPKTFGRLNTKYTFTKGKRKGQTVTYGAPTRRDSKGRPIYAKRKVITVEDWNGRKFKTTARLASRMISAGQIPYQPLGERA